MGNCCVGAGVATAVTSAPSPPPLRREKRSSFISRLKKKKDRPAPEGEGALNSVSATVGTDPSLKEGAAHDRNPIQGFTATALQLTAPPAYVDDAPSDHSAGALRVSTSNAAPQHGDVKSSIFDPLMPDLYQVSASSSSSPSPSCFTRIEKFETCDDCIDAPQDGGIHSSLVEVSQPTQSFRGDINTYSEVDITSEWEPPSLEYLGRRPDRTRRSGQDRSRLHHLMASEAEARASLSGMYAHQHQRLLWHLTEKRFIAEHAITLQQCQSEWAAQCICWIMAVEHVMRKCVAREWWAERAALVRRVRFLRTLPRTGGGDDATPDTASSRRLMREKSSPLVSNFQTAADLTSSEEAAGDESSNTGSPYVRASSLVFSVASTYRRHSRHSTPTRSSSAATGISGRRYLTPVGGAMLPVSASFSCGSGPSYPLSRRRSVTAAQKALHDKSVQGCLVEAAEERP